VRKRLILWCVGGLLWSSAGVAFGDGLLPPPFSDRNVEATRSCAELDRSVARLLPLTYGYTPSIYSDPAMGAAVWVGVFIHPAALGYIGYRGYYAQWEEMQRDDRRRRIEALRRVKAEKRCFEDI